MRAKHGNCPSDIPSSEFHRNDRGFSDSPNKRQEHFAATEHRSSVTSTNDFRNPKRVSGFNPSVPNVFYPYNRNSPEIMLTGLNNPIGDFAPFNQIAERATRREHVHAILANCSRTTMASRSDSSNCSNNCFVRRSTFSSIGSPSSSTSAAPTYRPGVNA